MAPSGAGALRQPGDRLLGIDAARGTAMVFVCLSHFLLTMGQMAPGFQPGYALTVTMVASPAFMIISGITFGYLAARSHDHPARVRIHLLDRALLLLVPVHVLVRLPFLGNRATVMQDLFTLEITDTIALAIILDLWLVAILRCRARLLVAAGLVAASWILNLTWHPQGFLLVAAKDLLARASWDGRSVLCGFAVLPWAGLHLAASVLGEQIADARRLDRWRPVLQRMALLAVSAMLAAVLFKAAHLWWKDGAIARAESDVGRIIADLVSPFGKYPPSPGYFAFCGGAGLLLLTFVLVVDRRGWLRPLREWLAVIGRASVCAWVMQSWIYWGALRWLPAPPVWLWPLLFVVSLAVVWLAASAWDARGWNRHLTVGLTVLLKRRQQVPAM